MWVNDPTTGVFRLATRNEVEDAMGDLPEGARLRGAWVRDQTTGVYRPATVNEAEAIYAVMSAEIMFSERRSRNRRNRRRRRRGRRHELP